jgi:hypothetical protein
MSDYSSYSACRRHTCCRLWPQERRVHFRRQLETKYTTCGCGARAKKGGAIRYSLRLLNENSRCGRASFERRDLLAIQATELKQQRKQRASGHSSDPRHRGEHLSRRCRSNLHRPFGIAPCLALSVVEDGVPTTGFHPSIATVHLSNLAEPITASGV